MDAKEVIDELYSYASKPRAFTAEDLLAFLENDIEPELLRQILANSKFLKLCSPYPDEDRYILDSELFMWFSRLNLRLAKYKQFRLTRHQVASLISNLLSKGKWNDAPSEAIKWGEALGLISSCHDKEQYVFPLARILRLNNRNLSYIYSEQIMNYCELRIWEIPLSKLINEQIEKGFARYNKNIAYIVQCREGLSDRKIDTLQELGSLFNLSRERVRQLEAKFWDWRGRLNRRFPFYLAFFYDFFHESGNLLIENKSPKGAFRSFLAKCIGIPCLELRRLNVSIIGLLPKEAKLLQNEKWDLPWINKSEIFNYFDFNLRLPLSKIDVQTLAYKIVQFREKYLSLGKKAYIALRSIGRPAHYSEITKRFNSIWPNNQISEINIHNCLSKRGNNIVWIGIKGTFALREWGFERPSNTLFKTIEDIVQKRFKETKQPVPFSVIVAELGKYRKIVHPQSLLIATHSNPGIKMVLKDLFVPREFKIEPSEAIPAEELDELFKEFRKSI